jgi:hypothetical protein
MAQEFPEADWKVFREAREVALERLCARILEELEAITNDSSRSHHQRCGAIFQLLRERDREVAYAFDSPPRSRMLDQLLEIYRLDLLSADEFARFTPATLRTSRADHQGLGPLGSLARIPTRRCS